MHHFVPIGEFKLEFQYGNAQFGSNSTFFRTVWPYIWQMALKNNRTPLLCCFQLCAWFRCHMCIQTGVRVRKRLSWVLTSVTMTFDFWPWPFAWTSLLSMVIIHENVMMIRWWEHGEKGVTDGRTNGQTDRQTGGLNQSYSCFVAANKKQLCNGLVSKMRNHGTFRYNSRCIDWK